jgi:hypothetical protein
MGDTINMEMELSVSHVCLYAQMPAEPLNFMNMCRRLSEKKEK